MVRKHTRFANAEQKRHWQELSELGCLITHSPEPTLAHCHGGSIIDTLGYSANPGWSQRQNHWLVIPLRYDLHLGERGLDTYQDGVRAWEKEFYPQIILLEWVCHLLNRNVFDKAGYDYELTTSGAWQDPPEPERKGQVELAETAS